MVPLSLVHNISLLVSLCLAEGLLMRWFKRRGWRYSILMGLLFGAATLVGMSTPVVFRPGLIFDGRSIVLGIAGLFGGPWVAATAAVMAGIFRLHLGGPGALMGIMVILESTLLGVLGYYLRRQRKGQLGIWELLALGGLIHIVMLALMDLLPGGLSLEVFRRLWFAILFIYPIGFMFVGLAFLELEQHFYMEKALQESEARYRSYVERAPDAVFIADENGAYLDVNPAACELTGYSREELLTMRIPDLLPQDSMAAGIQHFANLKAQGISTGEFVFLGKDGRRRWWSVDAVKLTGTRYMGYAKEITQRKDSEAALLESESKLQMLLSSTAEGIYGIDMRGNCTFCNPACLRLTGYRSAHQLLGKNMHDLIHHSDKEGKPSLARTCRIFRAFREGLGIHVDDEVFWRADGTSFPVEYWSYPQRNGDQILGAVVTFVDITERKRAEEEQARLQTQLNQAQKMESLGSLAGGIAHDMNNVLGAILGLASANVERQAAGSPARQAFETIIKAAERGGKMVQGLLTFARRTSAEVRELNLNEVIQEEVHLLEHTTLSKVRIEMDLAKDLRPILGDANTLTHALMNLCVNAVDALPENGTLILRTRNVDQGWIEVQVEDNGIGMPKEILERAADPFFTTKKQGRGTGLGLSLVYSTMKAHRGQMEIQSEPGQGTCVSLRFPTCEPAVRLTELVAERGSKPPQKQLEVLVIDDDELIQTSLKMLLETLGHIVTSTPNGEEALAKFEAGYQADLVILDLNMPGLGGAGTLPRLRALRPEVPVLLATGRSTQTALDLVEGDANTTLLSKPFSMGELKARIEATLKRP